MKTLRAPRWAVALVALLVIAPSVRSDEAKTPVPVTLGSGSVLWLTGTSTLHAFESRTGQVAVSLDRDPAMPAGDLAQLIRSGAIHQVAVTVPVATLKSEKDGLDKNLRKTLKADQYPDVKFRLAGYHPGTTTADTLALQAEGALTITGVEKPVTLAARAYPGDHGVWLEGQYKLRMTDYGIKPPTLMLGTLRVGDEITVHYRLLLVSTGAATGPSGPVTR